MNNRKGHDAQDIPPVKRRIIIHDTSESEEDTTDLEAPELSQAHIIIDGSADGQHQGISSSGDSIQHSQVASTAGSSAAC